MPRLPAHPQRPSATTALLMGRAGCWALVSGLLCAVATADEGWKTHLVAEGFANPTVVAADFNGDGLPDVVTFGEGRARLYTAPDWRETIIDVPEAPRRWIHSEVLDVNGDGRPDVIGACYSRPGLIYWLECPEDPTAGRWQAHVIDDQVDGIHGLIVGDINGDGRLDLAANSAQPQGPLANSVVWYRVPKDAAAQRRPWPRTVLAQGDAPGLSHYIGLGDINGNGRVDVATGAKGGPMAEPGTGDWFAWWEAPADPTRDGWTKHLVSDDEPGATNILPADVNGDSVIDLVASRGHGEGVVWFEGPDWRRHDIHATLAGPHCLAIGDINGNGRVDVVTCAKDDRLACWFENDGRGNFTTHVLRRDQAAYDIRLVDMDGDGDLDILIAGQASRNVVWLENPTRHPSVTPSVR